MGNKLQFELPSLPPVSDPQLYSYLSGLHQVVANITSQYQAPTPPTSLSVTPIAGGNVVRFTRCNAITYALYMGDSADRAKAQQVNLGSSATYTDNVGAGGVARWYWVEGLNQLGIPSTVTGPVTGTTLALGTPAAPLPAQAQSYATVFDTIIGRPRPVISAIDTEVAGQPTPT